MTDNTQPDALRLAALYDADAWPGGLSLNAWAAASAAELRRLHAENVRLQQELIRESHRTAEQKLRADQMTRQHADQAAMNREARAQLAALVEAQQPSPTPQADSQPAPTNTRQIAECYGDCPTDPKTCANPCKFEGRAARAPADSGAAPAAFQRALDIRTAQGWKLGGDKVPVLYTDTINGKQVCRDDLWLCTTAAFATPPAQAADSVLEDADPIRTLIGQHAAILDQNESAYFELCYHRATGWMAWITDKPLCMPPVVNPDRKVLAQGQGDTADEACRNAARKQGGAT